MKIVHLTTTDDLDGAGIAARRLHEALLRANVDSKMIVWKKNTKLQTVYQVRRLYYIDLFLNKLAFLFGLRNLFVLNSIFVRFHPIFRAADVIHIHNIQYENFFSILALPKNKKIIWTLHDMWALTGFCNYTYESCKKYESGCGKCPLNFSIWDFFKSKLGITKNIPIYKGFKIPYMHLFIDTTKLFWKIKQRLFADRNITFVAPSHWIANKAKASGITLNKQITVIPNLIGPEFYNFSETIHISTEKWKLLFIGQASQNNDRKGFSYFLEMLKNLDNSLFEIILVGNIKLDTKEKITKLGFDYVLHKPIANINKIIKIYKSAHITVVPSVEDNFPNIILESLSLGVPVVAFNTGGIADLINTKTGYLAEFPSVIDLAIGITKIKNNYPIYSKFLLNNSEKYAEKNLIANFLSNYSQIKTD